MGNQNFCRSTVPKQTDIACKYRSLLYVTGKKSFNRYHNIKYNYIIVKQKDFDEDLINIEHERMKLHCQLQQSSNHQRLISTQVFKIVHQNTKLREVHDRTGEPNDMQEKNVEFVAGICPYSPTEIICFLRSYCPYLTTYRLPFLTHMKEPTVMSNKNKEKKKKVNVLLHKENQKEKEKR